jgi:3-deoxy-D-manno-octulosonic acid (KDO) 8-phosphate synthase
MYFKRFLATNNKYISVIAHSTHRIRKKKLVISNTGKCFCFNNNVSNLYNNSVVEKINSMAYIFTLLMFRKPNKTTINKNKTIIFIGLYPIISIYDS